jgi:hypothetical protein
MKSVFGYVCIVGGRVVFPVKVVCFLRSSSVAEDGKNRTLLVQK